MHTDRHAPERPDVNEMVVIHRVFRREFAQIPRLVREVRDGDISRARVVADHLGLVMAGLHMHHTGEDAVLWPLLLDRAAPSTALVETMQEQHHRVDEHVAQVEALSAAWSRDPSAIRREQLARLVEQLAAALLEHLDLEEADEGERQRMLAHLPAPIRVVMRTVGAWQYRRYITRVRAA